MSGCLSVDGLLKSEKAHLGRRRNNLSRLDARVKLVLVVVAVVCNVSRPDYRLSLGLLLTAWGGMVAARVPFRQAIWFVLAPLWASLPVVAGLALGLGKTPFITLGHLSIYHEGLMEGGQAALRVLADTAWSGLLFLTTPFTEILAALRWFRDRPWLWIPWDSCTGIFSCCGKSSAPCGFLPEPVAACSAGAGSGVPPEPLRPQVFMRAYDRAERIQEAKKSRGGG